ncbi:hypothetical protein BC332_10936 [Capsicum chinense]|nr:hypothetical protein BC332_10936 [Capsicum chinense]
MCVGRQCSNEKNEQRRKLFSKDCVRLIGISSDFEEFEEERVDVICDVTNINIAVKQTYKDKQTLANVMELHAFMKQFSYRTERSSGSRSPHYQFGVLFITIFVVHVDTPYGLPSPEVPL